MAITEALETNHGTYGETIWVSLVLFKIIQGKIIRDSLKEKLLKTANAA